MKQDLMVFTKTKGWGIHNKSWWVLWYWNSLGALYTQNNNNNNNNNDNNNNNNNSVIYFNSFGVEHIPKEVRAFINRTS